VDSGFWSGTIGAGIPASLPGLVSEDSPATDGCYPAIKDTPIWTDNEIVSFIMNSRDVDSAKT
jgi:hypothetical protein